MARPAGIQQRSAHYTRAGVVLALSPSSDPTFRIQLRRALGSSTGTFTNLPDVAGTYGPGMPVTYTDVLPDDGQYRVYQTRSIRDGYGTSGTWGNTLKLKPSVLPDGSIIATPVTGNKMGSNLSVSTGQKIQFGSANVASSYAKTVRFAAGGGGGMTPMGSSITDWANEGTQFACKLGLTGTTKQQYVQSFVLPRGATVVKAAITYTRLSTATQTFWYTLYSFSSNGAQTTLVSFKPAVTGTTIGSPPKTVSSSSFTAPTNSANLVAFLAMKATAPGLVPPSLYYTDLTYRIGQVNVSI